MEFGIFSESGYRRNAVAAQAYAEDIQEIVVADRLGFREAWVAETNAVRPTTVTHASLIIANAAAVTKQIRFGSGIRQLPLHHPVSLVQEANLLDQVTGGRYIFGYGGTHLLSLAQLYMRGIDVGPDDTRPMVTEGVEFLMKCWTSDEPFDFQGRYWRGKDIHVLPKSFQQPHPPIAAACTGSFETIELAAGHGFVPLFGRGNDRAENVRQWAETYLECATAAGWTPTRRSFHVTHFVYVADTDDKARADLRPSMTALLEARRGESLLYQMHRPPEDRTQEMSFDGMCDQGAFWVGSPDTVSQRVRDYFVATGGFGVLLFSAGQPFATPRKRARSMRLFMERVAPRLSDLDPDRELAATAATR
ncbi:MAG: alkane 1-monooxygenase [Chloroflexi bacterium]|nr:alkane 1-monooxygenase [Chloroflexota bacterium]